MLKLFLKKSFLRCLICLQLFYSPLVFARFFVEDADEVDREEVLSTEYYNDVQSYAFFDSWLEAFERKDVGLLMGAGSLNKTRFFYEDYMKFGAKREPGAFLRFWHQTQHDEISLTKENVIELGYHDKRHFSLSILGEGDSQKKWADLGLRVHIGTDPKTSELVITYWSVDHYYKSKEDIKTDSYAQPIFSYEVQAKVRGANIPIEIHIHSLFDSPLEWRRLSRNYVYSFHKIQNEISLIYFKNNNSLSIKAFEEDKKESKTWLASRGEAALEKSLNRRFQLYSLKLARQDMVGSLLSSELGFIKRAANYEYSQSEWQEDPLYGIERFSPDQKRREIFAHIFYYLPVEEASGSAYQFGLINNWVSLLEDQAEETDKFECKLQTAFDMKINPQSRVALNLTWDLDQLGNDFPYNKRPFKPWGGGNFSLTMIF